jgi:hypothetical protein
VNAKEWFGIGGRPRMLWERSLLDVDKETPLRNAPAVFRDEPAEVRSQERVLSEDADTVPVETFVRPYKGSDLQWPRASGGLPWSPPPRALPDGTYLYETPGEAGRAILRGGMGR